MKRTWAGIALLASSWIFGLSYFYHFHWAIGAAMVLAGALCLWGEEVRIPGRSALTAALILLIPCAIFCRWPYRMIPALLIPGLLLLVLPSRHRAARRLGTAFVVAGAVLLGQALMLQVYMNLTGRSHELFPPLPRILQWMATLLGMDAAAAGSNLALFSMRRIHEIGATWELFCDPATLSFLAGGLVVLVLKSWLSTHRTGNIKRFAGQALGLVLPVLVWLPVRTGLMLSVYMHRVLLADYEAPLNPLMAQFWNPWFHAALLIVPVLLAIRFAGAPEAGQHPQAEDGRAHAGIGRGRLLSAASLVALGCCALTLSLYWTPAGKRKPGRILVDEYHSGAPWTGKGFDTTRTDRPFDTEWYGHDSSYNYAAIYDYCTRFYEMSRLFTAIDRETLRNADVLFLKVPSAPYSDDEVSAVREFVEQGGGLLLMGEHTSVFGSGVNLNRMASEFGFRFRYDCLFGIDSVFKQRYHPPQMPHPIIRTMPFLDFAVSCSIAPGMSPGTAVIRATGLKNLGADYHASNFYPQAVDEPEMRYGAFIQLWATTCGRGRVAAFTDSTIFANFSAFEPGKSELMLGMLEWLNHANSLFPRGLLALAGIILCVAGIVCTRGRKETWLVMMAAGMFGWTVAGIGVNSLGMRPPEAKRPMVRVVLDRHISGASLPESGFIAGEEDCFGQFERSILRLGYFTFRSDQNRAFEGDGLIILHPDKTPHPGFMKRLNDYVNAGGRVLILDSPENAHSTANDLLRSFGLSVMHGTQFQGVLSTSPGYPSIPVPAAFEVIGGEAIASLAGKTVAATVHTGKGSVTIIGFGSRFSDANMGVIGDVIPDEKLRPVFDFEYALLRTLVCSKQ